MRSLFGGINRTKNDTSLSRLGSLFDAGRLTVEADEAAIMCDSLRKSKIRQFRQNAHNDISSFGLKTRLLMSERCETFVANLDNGLLLLGRFDDELLPPTPQAVAGNPRSFSELDIAVFHDRLLEYENGTVFQNFATSDVLYPSNKSLVPEKTGKSGGYKYVIVQLEQLVGLALAIDGERVAYTNPISQTSMDDFSKCLRQFVHFNNWSSKISLAVSIVEDDAILHPFYFDEMCDGYGRMYEDWAKDFRRATGSQFQRFITPLVDHAQCLPRSLQWKIEEMEEDEREAEMDFVETQILGMC